MEHYPAERIPAGRPPAIDCFHLLDNFSGSPRALASVVAALAELGFDPLVHCSAGPGILSLSAAGRRRTIVYRWTEHRALTAALLCLAQVQIFVRVLAMPREANPNPAARRIVYVNTILPFGAALAGRLRGFRVVYHVHERYLRPGLMQRLCSRTMRMCADEAICVSRWIARGIPGSTPRSVVPDTLDPVFDDHARPLARRRAENGPGDPPLVVMVSSLRRYKGVPGFFELARRLPSWRFRLAAGADDAGVARWLRSEPAPPNLAIDSARPDLLPLYATADILVNLTRPSECVESFGLSLLEAMACGVPVVAPDRGGPAELVRDGIDGFLADTENLAEVAERLCRILENRVVYRRFSLSARERADHFGYCGMKAALGTALGFPESAPAEFFVP